MFMVCFLVGFVLSLTSLLFGMDHGHFGGHGGGHGGGSGIGSQGHGGPVGHGHGAAGHGHGGSAAHSHGSDSSGDGEGGVNFFSYNGVVMFLTWFGGVGYILNRQVHGFLLISFLGAIAAGLVGAGVVFYFLNSFLLKGQTCMLESEYYLPGTLARVCSSFGSGQTGEIVYVQGGTRKTAGARGEDGTAHIQGEEVLIVRYDKGIAYVKSVTDELGAG
jgi:hypothetical protein